MAIVTQVWQAQYWANGSVVYGASNTYASEVYDPATGFCNLSGDGVIGLGDMVVGRYNSKDNVTCLRFAPGSNYSKVVITCHNSKNYSSYLDVKYLITTTKRENPTKESLDSVTETGTYSCVTGGYAENTLTLNYNFKKGVVYYIYMWGNSYDSWRFRWYADEPGMYGFSAKYTEPVTYTLSTTIGEGTSLTVSRTSSNFGTKGTLTNKAVLYKGDKLTIKFSEYSGYTLLSCTVNGNAFTSGNTHTVNGDVSIVTSGIVKSFELSISEGDGTSITVNRTSSPKGGAPKGELVSGDTIYFSDEISIHIVANDGYEISQQSHNNGSYVVSTAISVSATANIKKYKINISSGTGVSVIVKNGAIQVANGSNVPHGTILSVSYVYNTGYEKDSESHDAGNYTITKNTSFSATAKKKKFSFAIVGDGGIESATGSGTYEYGSSIKSIVTAKTGFELEKYTVTKEGSPAQVLTSCAGLDIHEETWEITSDLYVEVSTVKIETGGRVSIKTNSGVKTFEIGIKTQSGFKSYGAFIKVNGDFKPFS